MFYKRKTKLGKLCRFTLIELLIVIAIIAILAALLFPALSKAKGLSRQIVCINNLKQWGIIVSEYSNDFDGYMPQPAPKSSATTSYGGYWDCYYCPLRELYLTNIPTQVWGSGNRINGCPEKLNPPFATWVGFTYRHWSYMICETTFGNTVGMTIKNNQIKNPGSLVYITENIDGRSDALFTTANYPTRLGFRHNGKTNLLWCDMHADTAPLTKISQNIFINQ
ncbi:MAG: hypothetical protein A2017_22220 [Lentisphaerae bacterium GWF2_44_16]|nr:MAG: hypothetical protein A2017_22220 [Lentisphaerae bacterium GWF2_44_16]